MRHPNFFEIGGVVCYSMCASTTSDFNLIWEVFHSTSWSSEQGTLRCFFCHRQQNSSVKFSQSALIPTECIPLILISSKLMQKYFHQQLSSVATVKTEIGKYEIFFDETRSERPLTATSVLLGGEKLS